MDREKKDRFLGEWHFVSRPVLDVHSLNLIRSVLTGILSVYTVNFLSCCMLIQRRVKFAAYTRNLLR